MNNKWSGCLLAIFAFASVAATAIAEDKLIPTRKTFKEWVMGPGRELRRKEARESLPQIQKLLRIAKAGRVVPSLKETSWTDTRIAFPDKKSKEAYIADLETTIGHAKQMIETPSVAFPVIDSREISVGMIGKLQIGDSASFEARQVIDDSNVLADMGTRSSPVLIWMQISTAGMVDGKRYSVEGKLFEISGTRKYETAVGASKTVFQVKEITDDELIEMIKDAVK